MTPASSIVTRAQCPQLHGGGDQARAFAGSSVRCLLTVSDDVSRRYTGVNKGGFFGLPLLACMRLQDWLSDC